MEPLAIVVVVVAMVVLAGLGARRVGPRRGVAEVRRLRRTAGVDASDDAAVRLRELESRVTELADREARDARDLDHLVEIVGVGVVHLTADLQVDAANTAAHRYLGRSPGSMMGRPALEAVVDARIEAVIVAAAADRAVVSAEIVSADADGPKLLVRARRSPGGVWLVLEDVSELRRLQRIRTEFIDNLSHELRTPLTTVSLLAETLSRDADAAAEAVPARMRDRIGKIEIETGHLVQMVNELLDLSRIESGRALALLDDVDLGRLAEASVERLRLFAERQRVRFEIVVEPDLPLVRGDEDRLGQVLVNLLHNAVKFSPNGGEVTVRAGTDGATVAVSVEDRGIGIPKASLDRVFERFYKVDRARVRSGGGTGLGLAIARHVVEQHGGRIRVESREGRGSTFTFELPIGPLPTVEPPTPIADATAV
ncbi:MAG: sensor histidine kinase [Candidatus Limnocylindrales bacterium]